MVDEVEEELRKLVEADVKKEEKKKLKEVVKTLRTRHKRERVFKPLPTASPIVPEPPIPKLNKIENFWKIFSVTGLLIFIILSFLFGYGIFKNKFGVATNLTTSCNQNVTTASCPVMPSCPSMPDCICNTTVNLPNNMTLRLLNSTG